MANSIREIVKEREIFERERMAGLSAGAYLGSKVLVLGLVSVVQTVLIVVIGLAGKSMPAHGSVISQAFVEILIGAAVLCLVSMLVGLMVSALVTKGEQTMPALVVIVMLQVVLSGAVFPLTGVGGWIASIAPARWGLGALGSTANLNAVMSPESHKDALWAHTPAQWFTDMAVLIGVGLICLIVAQWRLGKVGPRQRK
jgi:hypothetical protein